MSHETWDAQAAAYALGALDGEELAEFERHLAEGCGQCDFALAQSAEALALLAGELPPAPPPRQVREALERRLAIEQARRGSGRHRPVAPLAVARALAGVSGHEPDGRVGAAAPARGADIRRDAARELRRTWWRWTAGVAAATIIGAFLAGGFVTMHYEGRLGQLTRQALVQRDQLRGEIAALQAHEAAYRDLVELLRDPAARVVALRGTGPAPGARGRLVWRDDAGGRLLVDNLPPAPEGRAYEAWTIRAGTPRPAGVFRVDASGNALHALPPAPGPVDVFAVTLEPSAGVAAPTGPIVLASTR